VNNAVFWDVTPCSIVIIYASGERIVSIFRMERISEVRTLAIPSLPKRRFLQDPHDVTSQKTAFFMYYIAGWFWRAQLQCYEAHQYTLYVNASQYKAICSLKVRLLSLSIFVYLTTLTVA
jgi:hypothetical protein